MGDTIRGLCLPRRCVGGARPTRVISRRGGGSGQAEMAPDDRENFRENNMGIASGIIFAGTVSRLASSAAWSQTPPAAKSAAPQGAARQTAPAPAAQAAPAALPATKQPPQPA